MAADLKARIQIAPIIRALQALANWPCSVQASNSGQPDLPSLTYHQDPMVAGIFGSHSIYGWQYYATPHDEELAVTILETDIHLILMWRFFAVRDAPGLARLGSHLQGHNLQYRDTPTWSLLEVEVQLLKQFRPASYKRIRLAALAWANRATQQEAILSLDNLEQ